MLGEAPLPTCSYKDLIYSGNGHTAPSTSYLCKTAAMNPEICGEYEMFNMFEVYWCMFGGLLYLFLPVVVLAIGIIFKYTAIAVDEFIATGIQRISESIGLSESLAAVTLLAFANGAGDVITAIVAGGGEGGVSYNIGALYGAGLFVLSAVVAIAIFICPDPIVYDPMIIYRDIGVYLLATIVTIVFAAFGHIDWYNAVVLLGLYVLLVSIVVVSDCITKDDEKGGDGDST